MSADIDTTPDYPEQPASLVEAAERDLPAVLQDMPNETGSGAGDPGRGHRVVLAEKLVEALAGQKGHAKAAAAWAVHRLAGRGLLRCEVAREFYPRVVGQRQVPGRVMFGVQRYREEPVYGTREVPLADPAAGPVPYGRLLLYSTDQLWAWWRSITGMLPTDPDMDSILRQVQAKREKGEAAERQYQDELARLSRLRDVFQAAASYSWQDHTAELRREPTREEFYRAWAERLAAFGRAIRDHDLAGWLEREYNPDNLAGQWTRGVLLRSCRTPEDVTGLQELLERSGDEQELQALRHRIRDAGELLLKEASSALATNEDADLLTRELASLREECRRRRLALDIWNVTLHGTPNFPEDCVRELWQRVRSVAYGVAEKAPPREPDQVPDVAAAHRALDEVMRWCEEQERNAGQATQDIKEAADPATHMAKLSLAQNQAVARLAGLFYDGDFLAASLASYTWLDAAAEHGLNAYWQQGSSKRRAIVGLLESTLLNQPDSFCGLILTVVRQGIRRRQGHALKPLPPITREAIDTINRLLSAAGLEVPAELNAPAFLDSLPTDRQDARPPDLVSTLSAVQPRSQRIGDVPIKASFGWLHLTDLHFGMSGQRWLWPNVREEFFGDLEKLHRKSGPWDLVLFTGDFVQKGGADEFGGLNDLLVRLWGHLRGLGSVPYLLGVPGNHDLVRPAPSDTAVAALRTGWGDSHIQQQFWSNQKSGYRKVVQKAFKNYLDWWDSLTLPRLDSQSPGVLPGDFSATLEKGGVKLGVVGLNTTFLQLEGGDYDGRLAVSPQQFHLACGGDGVDWVKGRQVCLLLTHQPPTWLTPDSRRAFNGEIAKPGRFAAHLFGHMHEAAARSSSQGGADARREWQGCSLFGLEEWGEGGGRKKRLHGYAAGRIEVEGEQGTIRQWPRLAVQHQAEHLHVVPDHSFTLEEDGGTRPEPVAVVPTPAT